MPLVNELVIGVADKDKFSVSMPKDDGQFADYVTHPSLPALLNILFRDAVNTTLGASIPDLAPSNFPRMDLVTAFLTGVPGVNQLAKVTPSEMVRLNTNIAATPAASQSAVRAPPAPALAACAGRARGLGWRPAPGTASGWRGR